MNIKRRDFLGFFLLGGLASLVVKKFGQKIDRTNRPHPSSPYQEEGWRGERVAMFWRRKG